MPRTKSGAIPLIYWQNSQNHGCNNYCNHGRMKVSHTTGDTSQAITTDHVERHFHTNRKGARHGHQRTPLHGRSTSPPRSRTRRTTTRPGPGAACTLNLPGGARIPPRHAHYQPTTGQTWPPQNKGTPNEHLPMANPVPIRLSCPHRLTHTDSHGYWCGLNDGQWSGVSGTGDGKSDFRGTADSVGDKVSSRLHSTGPWWV